MQICILIGLGGFGKFLSEQIDQLRLTHPLSPVWLTAAQPADDLTQSLGKAHTAGDGKRTLGAGAEARQGAGVRDWRWAHERRNLHGFRRCGRRSPSRTSAHLAPRSSKATGCLRLHGRWAHCRVGGVPSVRASRRSRSDSSQRTLAISGFPTISTRTIRSPSLSPSSRS